MSEAQQTAEADPFENIEREAAAYEGEAANDAGPPAEVEGPSTADMLEQVLAPTFQIVAPAWQVQPAEVKALAGAYAGVMDKYLPDGPTAMGPEIAAAMTTLAVFGPRIGTPRHPPKAKGQGGQGQRQAQPEKGQAQANLSDVQRQFVDMDDPTAGEKR